MKIARFEDLIAWQKARALNAAIYQATRATAFARDFALITQIRKAAISVSANIAEGFERGRRGEFHQFLSIAKGSCAEVRTYLYLAYDAGYIDSALLQALLRQAEEVARIVGGLRRSVEPKAKIRMTA